MNKKIAQFYLYPLLVIAAVVFVFGSSAGVAHANAANDLASVYQPIVDTVKQILFMLVASFGYIFVMSHMLQWIISNPQWANTHSELVKTGLGFTYAFADMLLIIIFLAIAFGFIFKIETFQSKKSLPKFVAAAILAQFAPVFVGMIIDIATVINHTLIASSQATIVTAFDALSGSILRNIVWLSGSLALQAATTAIPIESNVAMLAGIAAFIGATLPSLPVYLCQIALGFLIGGILFLYVMFFMIRVYMLQFIAIASPLVVVAWALPQTSHYFKTIFGELVKWAFVGTLILFLLILGLRSSASIRPDDTSFTSNIVGFSFNIEGYIAYYLFLFIYMSTIAYIVNKNLPAIGTAIQGTLMGVGGMMMARAVMPSMNSAARYSSRLNDQKQKEANATDEQGNKTAGLGTRAAAGLTGFAAGALGRSASYMAKPGVNAEPTMSAQASPRITAQTDEAVKNMGEKTADATQTYLNKKGGLDKVSIIDQAATFKNLAESPEEMKKFVEKNGQDKVLRSLDQLAKKPGYISKATLTQALSALPNGANALINSPQMKQIMTPGGPNGIADNKDYQKAKDLGLQGEEAEDFAAQVAWMKELSKTKKVGDLKLDEMLENNPKLIEPMVIGFSKTLGKALGTMAPEKAKKVADFVNDQTDEYLAAAAPELLQTGGKGGGGMGKFLKNRPAFKQPKNGTGKIPANDRIVQYRDKYKNTPREERAARTPEDLLNRQRNAQAERAADADQMLHDMGNVGNPPPDDTTPPPGAGAP